MRWYYPIVILCAMGFISTYFLVVDSTVGEVTGNGIFEYLNKPCMIHYDNVHNRTYIGYIKDRDGDGLVGSVCIKYYDHDLSSFSSEVILWNVTNSDGSDDHAAPTILILQDGKILVFWSDGHHVAYGDPYCRRSTNSENISTWGAAVQISSVCGIYPNPVQASNGDVYVSVRYNEDHIHQYKSTDNGSTWDAGRNLVYFAGTYATYGASYSMSYQDRDDLDNVSFMITSGTNPRHDIHYMKSLDGGATWRNMSGSIISLPANESEMDTAFVDTEIRQLDLNFDASGYPHILCNVDISSDSTPPLYHVWWTGAAWSYENTGASCGEYYQSLQGNAYTTGACFHDGDPSIIYVSKANGSYSDMEVWEKSGSWSKTGAITTGAASWKIRPMPVYESCSDMVCCWSDGTYNGYTDYDTDIDYYGAEGGGPGTYDPPVITSMGYTGVYNLSNQSVMVGDFYINWSYDTNGTPSSHLVSIASDTGFESIIWNYNVTHVEEWNGYGNITIDNLTASISKRYVHVRTFYGGV